MSGRDTLKLIIILLFIVIVGGPGVLIDLRGEIDDHFQHREIALCVGHWNVKGWIPYTMRVDKKQCFLPPYADPWKYIKNYDPNNSKHMSIVIDSLEGEE